jgi:RNA polymerase sigma-70 factor, ECF subfamily
MNDQGQPPDAGSASWRRFLEEYEPLRPNLYRYCRFLTRAPWDAEDLVQDTLARAFVALSETADPPPNARAWLFRVASNHWINQIARRREPPTEVEAQAGSDPRATREAAGSLFARLAPQERAALVLKDVFAFTLEDVAAALDTTVGAVKAALHRGRGKLLEPVDDPASPPTPLVLDAFCRAFNDRDVEQLTALLREDVVIEFPGLHTERGVRGARVALSAALYGVTAEDCGGIAPRWRSGLLPEPPRIELRRHRGEPLLFHFFRHRDGEAVRALARVTCEGGAVSRIRMYFHTPEVIGEVCQEAGLPYFTNGYRHWW